MNIITKEVTDDKTIFRYSSGGDEFTVTFDNEGATAIESNMKEELPRDPSDIAFNNAIDGFEALILGLVGQDIDISTREMQFAIQSALDAIGNQFP